MTTPSNRLRVAHVTLGLEIGGQERLLVEMARHADHARFDWLVVVLGQRGTLADAIEATGARILALNTAPGFRVGLYRQLARVFRQEQVAAVHTHDDSPLIYAAPAAWWAGVPTRIHTHHHGRLPTTWRRRLLIRGAARFTQRFVCVSQDSARFMIEQGINAACIETLWNGIDLARFAYSGPRDDGPIVTVARLSPEKDVANLIHAAARVAKIHPTARFEIAGDGPCRAELTQLIHDLGLTANVILLGAVGDIPALLSRARLFVLPSQTEGISLTLLEAMARGLPVIATRVGGTPELIDSDAVGSLVPSCDPDSLARAIAVNLADPERGRCMGQAARQRVETSFDIRKMMAQYEALYVSPSSLGERQAPG